MTLRNAVNEVMDFAKAHECDLTVAQAKMTEEITSGSRDFMTLEELNRAKAFLVANYNTVVEARQTGDNTAYDKALAEWEDEH